jgi:hypothetical protein
VSDKAFPKPRDTGSGYRKISTPLPKVDPIAPAKHTVATLADPPIEETDIEKVAQTQLSRDEIQAILAVNKSNTITRWGKTKSRFAIAAFPTFFVSILTDQLFGWWGIPVTIALGALWAVYPMWKQDREGW